MDDMSETIESVSQDAVPETEIAQTPAIDTAPDTGNEPTPEPVEPVAEPATPKQQPWFQKRIDELTREKYEERRKAERLESELRKIQQPPENVPQVAAGTIPVEEVERRAAEIVEQRTFVAACNEVADVGLAKYPDFQQAVKNYEMIGGVPPEFLKAVTSLGKEDGAKVYYDLGIDPDRASRILALPPVQMAMEVAKLAFSPAKPVAPVSRVPPPITPIASAPVRGGVPDPEKNASEYRKWFEEEYRKSRRA